MKAFAINWAFLFLFLGQVFGQAQEQKPYSGEASEKLAQEKPEWENLEYQRYLDLSGTGLAEEIRIVAKNVGDKPATDYHMLLPRNVIDNLSVFTATADNSSFVSFRALSATLKQLNNTAIGYGFLGLPRSVEPGETINLRLIYKFNDCGTPKPKKIGLGEDQFLVYETDRLPLSQYPTKMSILKITGSTDMSELDIGSVPEEYQGTFDDNVMTFGPFEDINALNVENKIKLRYLHNLALNEVIYLKRDIWVSHWASTIQFVEYNEYHNKGAELKNGFSRLEVMKNAQAANSPTVRGIIENHLPEQATEHYFVDKVGQVSTSQVVNNLFYLKPRFPIFGGWFYNYTIGWTNELSDFLRVSDMDSEEFILAVPLLNGPKDTAYDEVEYSVYLPEGATVIDTKSPLPVVQTTTSFESSYFDLKNGHTKVTLKFRNLVSELADGKILITYKLTNANFYGKFLNISLYGFIALMAIFLLNSINLRVSKN